MDSVVCNCGDRASLREEGRSWYWRCGSTKGFGDLCNYKEYCNGIHFGPRDRSNIEDTRMYACAALEAIEELTRKVDRLEKMMEK